MNAMSKNTAKNFYAIKQDAAVRDEMMPGKPEHSPHVRVAKFCLSENEAKI